MFSKKALLSCSFALLLSACGVNKVTLPDRIKEVLPPQTPVRAITGFTPGLQCMDNMFMQYKVKPIRVTAAQIPDFSESRGDAGYGAREMLISAISAMSQHSGAIRFIAYDRSTPDIIALQSAHPRKQEFMIPDFFIRGAVTQIDSSPYSKQNGYSVSADNIDEKEIQSGSASNSNSISLKSVAADLNMGLINNFEVLPGIMSSNNFTVTKIGNSDDFSLNIWKMGAVYSLNENRADVLSSGLRALMEVGAIELFGKLYNLPYWECLGMLGDDTEMEAKAARVYAEKSKEARIKWMGDELVRQDYLKSGVDYMRGDGEISDAFRRALSHYRIKHDLFGNSLITEEVFKLMYREHAMHMQIKAGAADGTGGNSIVDAQSAADQAAAEAAEKAAEAAAKTRAAKPAAKKASVKR